MSSPNPEKDKIKIAILGGCFDPVTKGHIAMAEAVLKETDIGQVWLQPCLKHPFASKSGASGFSLRYWMCVMATQHMLGTQRRPGIWVSKFEQRMVMKGPFKTYDVLQKMLKNPYFKEQGFEFSYVIGMDNANGFHKWANWEALTKLLPFIVVPRDGVKPDPKITWYQSAPHTCLKTSVGNISSTMVREAVKAGDWDQVDKMVNPGVRNMIEEHKLYQ